MLQFDIQEIPEGKSNKNVRLPEFYFEFDDNSKLTGGEVSIEFYRTDHFIKVSFTVDASLKLICDRCLEEFILETSGSFDILFEPGEIEEFESEESAVRQINSDTLHLDIEKEVRDTIVLEIPGRKIHPKYIKDDGSVKDYKTKSFGKVDDDEKQTDPRWDELKKLK